MPEPTLIERLRWLSNDRSSKPRDSILIRKGADTLERYEREREALLSEKAVWAGARAFAQGFSGAHPCQQSPCEECVSDSRRVLRAALQRAQEQVGE